MSHIFISYSRIDLDIAEKIVNALARDDLEPWIDWKSIPKGETFEREIQQGIEKAEIFLFLVSPDSVQSEWCNKEIVHAVKNGKRILPVVIRDTEPKNIHSEISRRNWILCRDGQDDFSKAIEETYKTIHADYGWLKFHTNLQLKSLEWERNDYEDSFLLQGRGLENSERFFIAGWGKEPTPTELQKKFIAKSRVVEDLKITERKKTRTRFRNLGVTLAGIAVCAIAVTGLAVLLGRQVGIFSKQLVVANATATFASGEVIQANATATIARGREEESARVARANDLAAQSVKFRENDLQLSLLLGVEAFNAFDNFQTRGTLLENLQSHPWIDRYFTFPHDSRMPEIINSSIAISPDGRTLAIADAFTIILMDLQTGHSIGTPIDRYPNPIEKVAFSPDGKILAASDISSITLWDIQTQTELEVHLYGEGVSSIFAFSPDGKIIASGSTSIFLWDVETGKRVGEKFPALESNILSVTFSPNGKFIATGSEFSEQNLNIWDIATRERIGGPLIGHANSVNSIAFSPDGKILASGSQDHTIKLWNTDTHEPIGQPLRSHTDGVSEIAFDPDGKILASGSNDKTVILWDVATQQPITQPYTENSSPVLNVAFSPDGKNLISGSDNGMIIIWNVTDTRVISSSQPLVETYISSNTTSLAYTPDGKTLAFGSVTLWDTTTQKSIAQLSAGGVYGIAISPNGKLLASARSDGTIVIWDLFKQEPIGEPILGADTLSLSTISFSPDSNALVSTYTSDVGYSVLLWDVNSGQLIGNPLDGHKSFINSVTFSPDGKMVASGSSDKTIILWDVGTQQPISQPLTGHTSSVESVVFSPDGKFLASGSDDQTIILWDVSTQQSIGQPLRGHVDEVNRLAFSPDGKILASSSMDKTIILWDMTTYQPIGNPLTHTDYLLPIVFSPDGKILASGGHDGIIVLWDLSTQSWINKTCQRIGRNITQAEWSQYFPGEPYRTTCSQWPVEE